MEIMAERPPKLARAVTAPILSELLPAPPPEAHVQNRCRTKRDLQIYQQEMENIVSGIRNRRTGPPITTSNDEDKDSSTESGEGVTPISGDAEESQGTY